MCEETERGWDEKVIRARIGLGGAARGTKGADARSWVGTMSGVGSVCEEDGETDDWCRVRRLARR